MMEQMSAEELSSLFAAWSVPEAGWNLRCNLCGKHPADWIADQRPGWGALALCEVHAAELQVEMDRHAAELRRLRKINYEQLPKSELNQLTCMFRKRGKP